MLIFFHLVQEIKSNNLHSLFAKPVSIRLFLVPSWNSGKLNVAGIFWESGSMIPCHYWSCSCLCPYVHFFIKYTTHLITHAVFTSCYSIYWAESVSSASLPCSNQFLRSPKGIKVMKMQNVIKKVCSCSHLIRVGMHCQNWH